MARYPRRRHTDPEGAQEVAEGAEALAGEDRVAALGRALWLVGRQYLPRPPCCWVSRPMHALVDLSDKDALRASIERRTQSSYSLDVNILLCASDTSSGQAADGSALPRGDADSDPYLLCVASPTLMSLSARVELFTREFSHSRYRPARPSATSSPGGPTRVRVAREERQNFSKSTSDSTAPFTARWRSGP